MVWQQPSMEAIPEDGESIPTDSFLDTSLLRNTLTRSMFSKREAMLVVCGIMLLAC